MSDVEILRAYRARLKELKRESPEQYQELESLLTELGMGYGVQFRNIDGKVRPLSRRAARLEADRPKPPRRPIPVFTTAQFVALRPGQVASVPLDRIVDEQRLIARRAGRPEFDEAKVRLYVGRYREDPDTVPPITIDADPSLGEFEGRRDTFYVYDGNHRLEAARRVGKTHIRAVKLSLENA